MSDPDYENSPQIISKEVQNNIWTTVKPVVSLAAISTALYIIGFVATNASLAMWGIYDPEPIHTSSILTGGLFFIYFAITLTPTLAYEYFRPRATRTGTWTLIVLIVLALFFASGTLITTAGHLSWKAFLSSPPLWGLSAFFVLVSCGVGVWLRQSPMVLVRARSRLDRTFIAFFAVIGLFALLYFFPFVYMLVPARWGGGEPVEREVWFSKDAIPILKAMNITTVQDGDLVKAPQVYVLYSRGDLQVFCEHRTCSKGFQIPKDWIKSQSWLININNASRANHSKSHSTP